MERKTTIGKEMYAIAEKLFEIGFPLEKELPKRARWIYARDTEAKSFGHSVILGSSEPVPMIMETDDGKLHFYEEGNRRRFSITKDGEIEVKIKTNTNEVVTENPRSITVKLLKSTRDTMKDLLKFNKERAKKNRQK